MIFRLLEEVSESQLRLELGSERPALLASRPERAVVNVGWVLTTVCVTNKIYAALNWSGHLS